MKRRYFIRRLGLFLSGLSLANCERSTPNSTRTNVLKDKESLEIWWQQGFYPEETNAIAMLIAQWSKESQVKVNLRTIPQKDILHEIELAIASGNPPDLFYSGVADLTIIPRLAWNNQLVDISETIAPIQELYGDKVLAGVNYQNKVTKDRRYYALPIMQSAIHIHYWQDILKEIGVKPGDIPQDWQGFWQFWTQIQNKLRQNGYSDMHSIGMPMSISLDTYNNFEQFLEAYDVTLLDHEGNLKVKEQQVRDNLALALEEYTGFYQQGLTPKDAIDWDNTGNNVSLLSENSLMTVNHTLSVPGSQRQDQQTYYQKLATVKWPNKPNGEAMRYIVELKQIVLFAASKRQQSAKNFLAYLAQPENLEAYTEGALGRYLPVMEKLFQEPFWQDPQDSHISVAVKQLQNTRPAYQVFHPAYGEVASQNIWGQAIGKIIVDNLSVEQATNFAIAKIEQIFDDWQ